MVPMFVRHTPKTRKSSRLPPVQSFGVTDLKDHSGIESLLTACLRKDMNWFNESLMSSVKLKWVTEGKRCRALELLYRTISDVLDQTPRTAIFAPEPGGLCTGVPLADVMVYLSPDLEIESQEQVDFTVAHEFAHVVLKHSPLCWDPEQSKKNEQTADGLARAWGFERPEQPYKINKEMLTVYRDYLASRATRECTDEL
jgi:hypothetical protein